MDFLLDSLLVFIIWTSMGIIIGAVLGIAVGQIKNNFKPLTKSFVQIFGIIGSVIGLVGFFVFMYLGNSRHGYVAFSIIDFIIGATLFLIASIPIYYLWFNKKVITNDNDR